MTAPTHAHTHSHTHSQRTPQLAVVEFALWLIWRAAQPLTALTEHVDMKSVAARRVLFLLAALLVVVNVAWLAA